jgi:DNA-binding CsgD family transcriptional regulator
MALDQTSRLLLDLYRAARESPIPEFHERALDLLKSRCRFDSAMWGFGEAQRSHRLAFDALHLHNLPEEALASYEEIKDHDLVAFEAFDVRRLGIVCNFNLRDMMPAARYADVASFDARWGLQNLLAETVYDKTMSSIEFIALWRAKEWDRYTEEERLLGEALLPHFIEAGTINRLASLSRMNGAAASRRGTRAIANQGGVLETCDAEFPDMLRKEWPDWSPPSLPGDLVRALRACSERRFVGKRIGVAASLNSGMLFLLAREKGNAEALTKAQLAVATLAAKGLSYKKVARDLGLSPATVRNHLHNAYVKLEVGNRTALARCLDEARA